MYFRDRVKLPKKRTHNEEVSKTEATTSRVQAKIKYPDLTSVVKFGKSGKFKKCRNSHYYLMLGKFIQKYLYIFFNNVYYYFSIT